MKRRFSLRYKLILIFGLLIAIASLVEGLLAIRIARKAVTEKIETHLVDKAADTAEIINGRITAFFKDLHGFRCYEIQRHRIGIKSTILKKKPVFVRIC